MNHYDFGGVHGPVQTGSGTQYNVSGGGSVVHGDQYNAGRDISAGTVDPRAELTTLLALLDQLRLTATERDAARAELAALEQAVSRQQPDRPAAGEHLRRFTEGLKEAGALANAGTTLVDSVTKLATWLGPIGAAVLALL